MCLEGVLERDQLVNGAVNEAPTPVAGGAPQPGGETDEGSVALGAGGVPDELPGLPQTGGGYSSAFPVPTAAGLPYAYYASLAAVGAAVALRRRR